MDSASNFLSLITVQKKGVREAEGQEKTTNVRKGWTHFDFLNQKNQNHLFMVQVALPKLVPFCRLHHEG